MNIIKLDAIHSTNSYLKDLAKKALPPPQTVVVAKKQTEGRGQKQALWVSQEGQSLTFSIFKRFDGFLASNQFIISMAVSLGLKNALARLNIPQIRIKWPNDILSANKKVCGILIENILEKHQIKYSIIGIGINVNEREFSGLPQASSLYLESGILFNLEEVFMVAVQSVFDQLENLEMKIYGELKDEYEKSLFRKNWVSFFENKYGKRFNGIIKGVAETGELLVDTEETGLQKFHLKELKMLY